MHKKLKAITGIERQREIYVHGISGKKLSVPTVFKILEEEAEKKMSPEAFAYVAGGAGSEATITANRKAFDQWKITPRVLKDVSSRSTEISLFGHSLPSPFLLAPVGVLDLAHAEADLAVAKAAAATNIPMIFSNQASFSMEQCAQEMGQSQRWFQLYWSKSNDLVSSLVSRAEACGCSAIVITLDTFLLGWRTRDLDLAYLPFLEGRGIAQYTSDPVFQKLLAAEKSESEEEIKPKVTLKTLKALKEMNKNYPGSFITNLTSGKARSAVKLFTNIYSRQNLTWQDLKFLRTVTKLPILLKGILHPEDAKKAIEFGIDGIIVSNHGGRQIDGSIGALDALPSISTAVDNQIPVLFDSGIRTGADVFKAIALGAKAVLLGRPYVYGLAIAGQQGVTDVIYNLMADFDITMGLTGCTKVEDITKEFLTKVV